MKYTSFIKLAIFAFALYANFSYAMFLFNPQHAGNVLLYSLALIADTLTIMILGYAWLSSLYFEFFKGRYYSELAYLKDKGAQLTKSTTAVLVPVVNEPISIIEKTVTAALLMTGNKKVYLLDDGGREELEALAARKGVSYLTRQNKAYNKSGNLNNALLHVKEDFVAVFDADFIPKRNFLTETLPLFSDATVGIVQTPQAYYNKNSFFAKGFKNYQNLFYQYIQPAKSLQHSAFCVGTNVVYRKSALNLIGGIPLLDHSEDVNTSLRMYENGYRTLFLDKVLAYGLSPDNVISFFNQQFRWSEGALTMLFKHNTLFNRKLTFDQRLHFFFSNMFYLVGVTIFIYLVTPLLAIVLNTSAINPDYFQQWLGAYIMFFAANFVLYTILGRNNVFYAAALGLFCYLPYVKAISAVIFNKKFTWKATGAHASDIVTRLIAPFLPYLVISGALFYMFATDFLTFQSTFMLYAFWIGVNSMVIFYLIIQSYLSILKMKKVEKVSQSFAIPYIRVQGA